MADKKFFQTAAPISIEAIAAMTGAVPVLRSGKNPDAARTFADVAPLSRAGDNDISFLDNIKYAETFGHSKAGACFVRVKYVDNAPPNMVLFVTEQPYYAYALTAQYFYPVAHISPSISPAAHIDETAKVGSGCRIDSGTVLGRNVKIGDNSWIGANTVISDGVEIGSNTIIGPLCSISHSIVGNHVIVHRGVHIGQDGFGFAPGRGSIIKVPQLGRVIIGDNVEIGSGTCIDRGAGPDTMIGAGSKIDNLVQIGHNVQIGRSVVVAAQTGIAGSTFVGDGVMIGGQVGISGHLNIGAGAKLAAQTGVMNDVPPGASFGGSPAVAIKDWHRQTIALAKIAGGKTE